MSTFSNAEFERWEELKTSHLLFGLSTDEQSEYDELSTRVPNDQADRFDHIVAALDVAWANAETSPLPAHLSRKILAHAHEELQPQRKPPFNALAGNNRTANYVPWFFAAACLAFAAFVSFWQWPTEKPVPDVAQLRAELIDSAPDVVKADWSAGTTPIPGATGDVVWSAQEQKGFMRFRGVPVNEPTKEQYQLWIFDKNQSDKTPIDGGVFDITSDGEVVVPIDAKLRVQDPFMFAVTVEKPGGVVVSAREQLPFLAKLNQEVRLYRL